MEGGDNQNIFTPTSISNNNSVVHGKSGFSFNESLDVPQENLRDKNSPTKEQTIPKAEIKLHNEIMESLIRRYVPERKNVFEDTVNDLS